MEWGSRDHPGHDSTICNIDPYYTLCLPATYPILFPQKSQTS